MKEYFEKYKKIIIGFMVAIAVVFGVQVVYAMTYVDEIIVIYPWDEFTLTEKIASTLKGSSKIYMTKQELYDKRLITKDQTMFKKFNDSYYKK